MRPLEMRGLKMSRGLTVTKWGPERTPVELLREYHPELTAGVTDERLQEIIDGAIRWIGGIRWSWTVVARNYLKDGSYHP